MAHTAATGAPAAATKASVGSNRTPRCPDHQEAASQSASADAIAGASHGDSSRLRRASAKKAPMRAAHRIWAWRGPGERRTIAIAAIRTPPAANACNPLRSSRNSTARFGAPISRTMTRRSLQPVSSTRGRAARRNKNRSRISRPNSAIRSGTPDKWTRASQRPNPGGLARRLESYLYGPPIRAFGTANWVRHEVTGWELQRFFIEEFVPLEDKTLARALSELEELEL